MEELKTYLLPPPLLVERAEMPPHILPRLQGVPAYGRPLPDQIEPFVSEPIAAAVSSELAERVRKAVLAHESLSKHLKGKRHEWIGVGVIDAKASADSGFGKGRGLLAVLYSYADNRAIEVRLDAAGKQVESVDHLAYQPPPTNAELERAIAMARADGRHEVAADLVGTAILVTSTDPQSSSFNHRQFDVRFSGTCDRLPRHAALVDLSTETVVSVGPCCQGDLAEEGEVGS